MKKVLKKSEKDTEHMKPNTCELGSWDNFVIIIGDGGSRNLYSDEDVINEHK